MSETVKVLIVEDLPTDAELCQREVSKALKDCRFLRVETRQEYLAALKEFKPDIIISDFKLPAFDGMTALKLALEICPETPFVLLTGSMNEDTAVECMKAGAWDYVIKEHVKRLGGVVLSVLEEKRLRIEKREADRQLKVSEERYRRISSLTSDVAYSCVTGADGGYTIDWLTGAVEAMTGYTHDEIMAESCWRFLVHDEDRALFDKHIVGLLAGQASSCELRLKKKDGTVVWVVARTECIKELNDPGRSRIYGGLTDITGRKQAETALRTSEARYRALFENSGTGIVIIDADGRYLLMNKNAAASFNLTPEEVVGRTMHELLPRETADKYLQFNRQLLETGGNREYEDTFQLASGERTFLIIDQCLQDENGRNYAVQSSSNDITDRKKSEEAILQSKIMLQNVIDSTPDWMYVKDREHRYRLVNKSFADAQNVLPQDIVGKCDTEFFPEELCFGDPSKGITGYHDDDNKAFEGRAVHNPRNVITWADGSLHIYDTYKIPLFDHSGTIYGALIYSRDITERQAAEDKLAASYDKLQKTFNDFISAMSKIVEMRDPYTAGHQTRVAGLSVAIAGELGLPGEQVNYIRVAALIHDIGKIYVPSDILSKPGKLSDIEWRLIRTHAQGSYDIMSTIEFPWPIADIVVQHHERIDGSGYPNGLTGDQIRLEAKIIAVADVVEAMGSHRPYRQALGIETALNEIVQKKGILYDPLIVDTCVKLFSEHRYELE